MFEISTPTDVPFKNGVEYIIRASGGALQVQRYKLDGTKEDVSGSPLSDGDEKFITTESQPKADATGTFLHLIPTGTVEVSLYPSKRQ